MIGVSVGQFECRRLLGEGGTGMVYLAVHRVLNTPRAVKVLRPEWCRYPELVRRFINEARAAAEISHRNIIGVHDCGQLPSGDWFILLDYLEGGTLSRYITSHGGPLAAHDVLHVLAEVANGLQAAHDRGIVHRDLKPDNIHLSARDGDPHAATILDFGVAKLRDRGGAATTAAGSLIGTPAYMAPEQLRGARVGPAADVFALGVIAYQMVSGGSLPYQREADPRDYYQLGAVELYQRVMTGRPNDLRRHNPAIGEGWVHAIGAALDPEPARRPATPRAFALMLAEATAGDGFLPGGVEILRSYARELLEVEAADQTLRAPAELPTSAGPMAVGTEVGAAGAELAAPRSRRYQPIRRIGAGGMAEVFEGALLGPEGFARAVAIKRVRDELSKEPAFATLFIAEARLASQLSHPNLVAVLDFDRDPEGRPFLVMEYVAGMDLAAMLRRGPLPVPEAIFIVTELLRGLGYAHQLLQRDGKRGLVHRDLSPHNVLLSHQGEVKVSDFGIAAALEPRGGARSTVVSGKLAYMSPEQVHAQPLDARADLFAAGIILWEMLAGRRLFAGATLEVMAKVMFKEIARPSQLRAGVPADLDAVVMKLLERDRRRRYGSALEVIEALMSCRDFPRDGRGAVVQLVAERAAMEPVSAATPGGGPDAARDVATVTSARPGELQSELVGEVLVAATELAATATMTTAPMTTAPTNELTNEPANDGAPADEQRAARGQTRRATTISTGQGERPGRDKARTLEEVRWLWPWRAIGWFCAVGGLLGAAAASSSLDGAGHLVDAAAAPGGDRAAVAALASPAPPAPPAAIQGAKASSHERLAREEAAPPELPPVELAAPSVSAPQASGDHGEASPGAAEAAPRRFREEIAHGVLVVAIRPWATVWINGRAYGETPLQAKLPIGRHRVRLTNHRAKRVVTVSIEASRATILEEEL
jgi:serine/threonine protein kinase